MGKTIVRIDANAVTARVTNEFNKILPQLTEVILADCNQYAKEREGALIASSQTATRFKEGVMIWRTPYAKRQYWEIKTAIPDKNPQARYKWVHYAKSKHQERWVKKAARLMGV